MTQTTAGNGQEAFPGAPADTAQRLIVNVQYIKDLSFENPRAPQSLAQQQATTPTVDINVDVNAQPLGPETFEVVLTVKASAKLNDEPVFLLELAYGAVITVRNIPQQMLPSMLLVETPRLMFPFARNIVADATREGGFPPLMINPIDFTELLRRNAAAASAPPSEAPPSVG
ncbi:MAG TPA: protein-export chaperone SecB [Stellaceae bacterium]|jgi:preprotein translocase subunit SecB|nr:protein-export chaperone SecB [Stellaceae bacterium]